MDVVERCTRAHPDSREPAITCQKKKKGGESCKLRYIPNAHPEPRHERGPTVAVRVRLGNRRAVASPSPWTPQEQNEYTQQNGARRAGWLTNQECTAKPVQRARGGLGSGSGSEKGRGTRVEQRGHRWEEKGGARPASTKPKCRTQRQSRMPVATLPCQRPYCPIRATDSNG